MRKKKLQIAFFGSSLVSAYWNGAATYYRGIIKTLHQRGHHITFYEPDAFQRQQHRDISDPEWADVVVYKPFLLDIERMLQKAATADVIVKASGIGVFDNEIAYEIANLKKSSNQIILWDVDAPATLDSIFGDNKHPLRPLIPNYDFVFTYGGGQPVVDAYLSLNAQKCIPVYNALDPDTHYKVPPVEKFNCDLAFLGNRLPDREERVNHFFIEVAEALQNKNFLLGGNGWENKPLPPNVNYVGHVYTYEHNAFNCTPKAVLNISRQSMAEYGFSPATRVFEAAGAGACIITDYWKGIELFLEPEKEIVVAKNKDEVAGFIKNLDYASAQKIGDAAREKVLALHTYHHRAKQVEDILLN